MNQRAILAFSLLLAGCQITVATPVHRAARVSRESSVTAGPSTAASSSATPMASPSGRSVPSPGSRPMATLQRPPGNVQDVSGVMRVEASYALRHGAHRIPGVEALLMDDAVAKLGDGGAGILSNNGATVIANNGGSFISDSGSSVISNNGGNVVSNHGGQLAAPAFALLATTDPPPVGATWPVAGMAVGVVDLASDQPVALGNDADGHAVYAIYTGANGAFHAYLPPATSTRRFVAEPLTGGDARLAYASLQGQADASVTLDERSLEVEHYVRQAFVHICNDLQNIDPATVIPGEEFNGRVPDANITEYDGNFRTFIHALRDPGVTGPSSTAHDALYLRLADIILAAIDIDQVEIVKTGPLGTYAGPNEKSLPALEDVLGQILDATARLMQREQAAGRDPAAYFTAQGYMQTLVTITGQAAPTIEKPSDFASFLTDALIASSTASNPNDYLAIAAVLTGNDFGIPVDQLARLFAAGGGIELAFDTVLFKNGSPTLAACLKALQDAAAKPRPVGSP